MCGILYKTRHNNAHSILVVSWAFLSSRFSTIRKQLAYFECIFEMLSYLVGSKCFCGQFKNLIKQWFMKRFANFSYTICQLCALFRVFIDKRELVSSEFNIAH